MENSYVDALARLATSDGVIDLIEIVVTIVCSHFVPRSIVAQMEVEHKTWMSSISRHLQNGYLPENKA